jgi:hypothetical protein
MNRIFKTYISAGGKTCAIPNNPDIKAAFDKGYMCMSNKYRIE